MTFWDLLAAAWAACEGKWTRILGGVQGTVSVISGMAGLIPESHLKYYLAASAVLTFWRGQYVADQNAQRDKQEIK